ncbi:MAG: hypothetical protein V4674_00490 [Patescibacteria group bacterium]
MDIRRIHQLVESRVLETDSLFAESAFIEILIKLNHILQLAATNGKRIQFTDDVIAQDEVKDVTDLVSKLRNAACHISSNTRKIDTNSFVFNRFVGHVPNGIRMGDITMGCDYADDAAFYYGPHRIYLNRHIKRVIRDLATSYGLTS